MTKIPSVDYSPLHNALQLSGDSAKAALVGRSIDLDKRKRGLERADTAFGAITGAASGILDVGKVVYGIFEQGALEKTKARLRDTEQEMKQKVRDMALSGSLQPGADGSIDIPQDFEALYQDRVKEIDASLDGFQNVQAWAKENLYSIYDSLKSTALSAAGERAVKERDTQSAQNLANALKVDVASGQFDQTQKVLASMTWISPTQKQTLTDQAKLQWEQGGRQKNVLAVAMNGGLDAANTLIQSYEAAGLPADEADALRNSAQYQVRVAGLSWTDKASQQLQAGMDAGMTGETAIASILATVPQAYRAEVQQSIQAEFKIKLQETDRVANEEIVDSHFKNGGDPFALKKMLLDETKGYSARMTSNSQMYWWALAEQGIAAAARGDETKPKSDEATLNYLQKIFRSRNVPNEQFLKELSNNGIRKNTDGSTTVLIQFDDWKEFMSGMSLREKNYFPEFADAFQTIETYYGSLRKKETDPKKLAQIQEDEARSRRRLIEFGSQKDIDKYLTTLPEFVKNILYSFNDEKVDIKDGDIPEYSGFMQDPKAKTGIAKYYRMAQDRTISDSDAPKTFIKLQEASDLFMQRIYGISKEDLEKEGARWIDSDPDKGSTLPVYLLSDDTGQKRGYMVRSNDAGDTLELYQWNAGPHGDAETSAAGGFWEPATTLKPRLDTREKRVGAAAKAIAEADLTKQPSQPKPTDRDSGDPTKDAFYADVLSEAQAKLTEEAVDLKVYGGSTVKAQRAPTEKERRKIAKEYAPKILEKWQALPKDSGATAEAFRVTSDLKEAEEKIYQLLGGK